MVALGLGGSGNEAQIFDLDTRLSFPCPVEEYLQQTLRPQQTVFADGPQPARYCRLVQASAFLQHFSSDRSHMLACFGTGSSPRANSSDSALKGALQHSGKPAHVLKPTYTAPPPLTPCIRGAGSISAHSLPRYWDMQQDRIRADRVISSFADLDPGPYGCVLTEQQMMRLCVVDGAQSS